MFRRKTNLCVLAVFSSLTIAVRAVGADGFMIRVSASPGQIMAGQTLLANVPRGTRLWCFSVKEGGWAEVKVPEENQHGWLYKSQLEVIELSDPEKGRLEQAYAHFDRHLELVKQQKLTEALREVELCLATERELKGNDHPATADTLNTLGNLVSDQGDYPVARKYYEEALAINRRVLGDEHASTAQTLNNLGVLARDQGDYPAARRYFEEALAVFRKVLGYEHTSTADMLNNLGVLARAQGDYPAARKYYEEALAIFRKVLGDDHMSAAATLNNLGVLARAQGDYAAARKYYEEALAITRKVLGEKHTSTAQTLNNLGVLTSSQGDYPAARKYFEEALAIKRKVLGDEHISTADTLNNLGVLVSDQGDYAAAHRYYEEALAIKRKVLDKEHASTADTLNNLGVLASSQGNYPVACTYFEETLAIKRKVLGDGHTSTADTLNNLGVLARIQGDYPAARKYFEESLASYRKILGDEHASTAQTLNNLGVLAWNQGDYPTARNYYDDALAIRRKVLGDEHPDTAMTFENRAWLAAAEGDAAAAGDYLQQARRAVRFHEVRTLPSLSQAEQLQFLENMHDRDWHESLSFGFFERNDGTIARLSAGWLINGKGVSHEALAAGLALASLETAPLVAELRTVRAELAKQSMKPPGAERDRQLKKLFGQQQDLERKLAAASGEVHLDDPWIKPEQVQHALSGKSVMMNLARFEPYDYKTTKRSAARYVAWLIPSGDGTIEIIDLGDAAPIDAAVSEFRSVMGAADSQLEATGEANADAEIQQALEPLAELVWKPLAEKLGDAEELVLSPDGALWLFPWAALPIEQDKFLIEKYKLRYAISGRELVDTRNTAKRPTKSVVMANPDYGLAPQNQTTDERSAGQLARRSLTRLGAPAPLPGTAAEARAVKPSLQEYGKTEPVMYLGAEATEGQFKQLASPRVLMIGTHGFFLDDQEVAVKDDDRLQLSGDQDRRAVLTTDGKPVENPLLRCGLLLAGCNAAEQADVAGAEDGVLTGQEIVLTDLSGTEMVVLSACDTGVGDVRNGEGVAGLRQAFELAGVKSVVATLWQISDEETAQLMTDYFVYLAQGQSKADALRYAQRNRINEHREKSGVAHPFYWAAFTLTGAG